jgi:hypothetical protein
MREFVWQLAVTERLVPQDPLNNCDAEILPRAVAKLASTPLSVAQWQLLTAVPWAHNLILIQKLGHGFAFVGRQYRMEISDRDFYLDLLFYHLRLRCFVVVDLKKGEFKPEYAGKMNFYCSAVDDLLRHEHDAPTIGLILCQSKDRRFAEYALRDIHKPIGLAEYELTRALPQELASSLPSIADLEAELGQEAAE